MAEQDPKRGPRVVRIPVARPLFSALSMVAFSAALLVGGSADKAPTVSAPPTGPTQRDAASAPGSDADWDVTPRDLVVGDRTGLLTIDQVLAGPLQVATLAASLDTAVDLTSGTPSSGSTSVPVILWNAYRSAVASAPTSCHLPVELLAAIGQVESGSLAGRRLDSHHRAVPAVLGPVLNGGAFAAIFDTDGGRLDGDPTWDRAVGPMQFIPSTWQRWGRDGNADGTRDPQNVEDSAYSAAAYLCAGGRDLSTSADLRSAILSYNHSDVYLADVLRLMKTVSPGGAVPRSVVTLPFAPSARTPMVGPPSRPPVLAAARPAGSTGATTSRPSTTSFVTGASRSTTSPATTPPGTPTWTSTANPTTTTASSTSTTTSASTTTSTTTGSSTTTTSTTTPTSCPTPTPSDSTTTTPTASSTTNIPDPASTTSPTPATTTETSTGAATETSAGASTDTSSSTTSSSTTTTGDPTPDPCATTPTDPPT